MTISEIRSALNAELDSQAVQFGENSTLADGDNTDITDRLAEVLNDLNPNHNYPPVPKI